MKKNNLSYRDLFLGAHTEIEIPTLSTLPNSILLITNNSLRERAINAFESADSLKAIWKLWGYFITCGFFQFIPKATVQSKVAEKFPELKDWGPVLEAQVPTNTLRGKKKKKRDQADNNWEITRGRTTSRKRNEWKQFKYQRLSNLVLEFQKLVTIRIRSICRQGVLLDQFQQPVDIVIKKALIPMAVTLDFGGESPPINFEKETARLSSKQYLQILSAVSNLCDVLGFQPTSILKKEDEKVNSDQSNQTEQLNPNFQDVKKNEDQTKEKKSETSDSDAESPPFLGVTFDNETGELTRHGKGEVYLSGIPAKLFMKLFEAAGKTVNFETLLNLWHGKGKYNGNEDVHNGIRLLNKEITNLGLKTKNKRTEGYALIDKDKPA